MRTIIYNLPILLQSKPTAPVEGAVVGVVVEEAVEEVVICTNVTSVTPPTVTPATSNSISWSTRERREDYQETATISTVFFSQLLVKHNSVCQQQLLNITTLLLLTLRFLQKKFFAIIPINPLTTTYCLLYPNWAVILPSWPSGQRGPLQNVRLPGV